MYQFSGYSIVTIPSHQYSAITRKTEEARLRLVKINVDNINFNEVLQQIVRLTADVLNVERSSIWFFDNDHEAIRCAVLFERSLNRFSEGATLRTVDFPNYFKALEEKRFVPAEEARTDPRTSGLKTVYLDPLGISSLLDAPIFMAGKIIGVLCNEHIGPSREWTTENRDFVASAADAVTLKFKSIQLKEAFSQLQVFQSEPTEKRLNETTTVFAAGLAHDLRNLLTVIVGNSDLIISDSNVTASTREKVRHILNAAQKGVLLTNELTALGGTTSFRPRIISVVDEINDSMALLQSSVADKHRIRFESQEIDDRVFIDPAQLQRILMNLVINARDASPENTGIVIDVNSVSNGVEISVIDYGTGIDPGIQKRIFDPFFTTKPKGKGNGLGLSIVKRITEMAGGRIAIESQLGKGTTIKVTLPRVGVKHAIS